MSRVQISLYGEDAEWFSEIREEVAERRDGNPPTRAELARMMMEQFEP